MLTLLLFLLLAGVGAPPEPHSGPVQRTGSGPDPPGEEPDRPRPIARETRSRTCMGHRG